MLHYIYCNAECHCAICHYAKCHYSLHHYADCHYDVRHYADCHHAVRHSADCHSAECHYSECHYAECRGAPPVTEPVFTKFKEINLQTSYEKCFYRSALSQY